MIGEADPAVIRWASEIRAQANALLHYATNDYDRERAHRLVAIAAEMMAAGLHLPPAEVAAIFNRSLSYITPLSVVDAAVFDEAGRILLIKRHDTGLWAMPGGACEVEETAATAVVRELYEEVGVHAEALALFGVWDSRRHPSRSALHLYMHTFLCRIIAGTPAPSPEATEVGFFMPTDLPPLSYGHAVRVPAACTLYHDRITTGHFTPYFDR
ncbi:MAG TPA: NUDIX hydrolase N-terminal domain-containing protein [Chloroflexia bacterium]|nr:NUDIX hydrolase N-terminal domain-containing protein [Chloroflexia bacterium]